MVIVQSHCSALRRFWATETETPTARPPILRPKTEGDGTSEERHRSQRAARGAPRRETHDFFTSTERASFRTWGFVYSQKCALESFVLLPYSRRIFLRVEYGPKYAHFSVVGYVFNSTGARYPPVFFLVEKSWFGSGPAKILPTHLGSVSPSDKKITVLAKRREPPPPKKNALLTREKSCSLPKN